MQPVLISIALMLSACAPAGYMYDTGSFVPHPRPEFCASRSQLYDYNTEQCIAPAPSASAQMPPPAYPAQAYSPPPPVAPVAFSNQGETYEQDRMWNDRIEHGACTRLHDRRTDSPADEAECNHDYASEPPCMTYKGFATVWYDMANDPNPVVSNPSFAIANLNDMGSKPDPAEPPYEQSPQFREVLRRLLNVTFSSARTKWSTRDQFADYAYKICMEGHPF